MGTNYYIKTDTCRECGHKPEGIHLGKSSHGWVFSFQYNGGKYYKNVETMKKWLKNKKIENEYGEAVTYKEFWDIVKSKQIKKTKRHAAIYDGPNEYMIKGYSFSDCEFS